MVRTERVMVDPRQPDPDLISRAAEVIRRGGLVAFPTETVYGLGANGLCERAVAGIFTAKGRPARNPLLLHIADLDQTGAVARDIPAVARSLMSRFWPGPLALIMLRGPSVPDIVTAGTDRVGIRLPDHSVARELIRKARTPLAAPSANASGKVSPTTADHVLADLDGRIDMVLDAGPTGVGIESTVLDLTRWPPVVVRPGGIPLEDLAVELGLTPEIALAARPDVVRYQGQAQVVVVEGDQTRRLVRLQELASELSGTRAVALVSQETSDRLGPFPLPVFISGSFSDPAQFAARLFSALRELGESHDVIVIEGTSEAGVGRAVMDRLRAASRKTAGPTTKVLIVCTGNTCRSPMAEALLRSGAGRAVEVRSAGTATIHDEASPHAVTVMRELGLDVSHHRARQLDPELLNWADLVLCMAESHRQAVLSLDTRMGSRTWLWSSYAGEHGDVPDPFAGSVERYRECRDQLSQQARRINARLTVEAGNQDPNREVTTDGRGGEHEGGGCI